ncbi:hypothetical protein SPRG_05459 [Saprolegnia parasitica CBS 223.65]|uniref:RecF/RecN/SMC N-terminal domain-containing protein n=1 Tax=Saprolegnia parasitica (strain CBS 223.65) TaxID=695850 RepID=A0A067CEV6_SAPPC|nr:hypothetical protein SPRG_05459 [Saprolegnia parasitica CBS 223.65]KDO29279.1 hypothetical protein SPRG_05459 [Saprolegnia parasitica CBS 223.65]|eukprot:XP_012200093.1 hypothetical protein SPRG_05459 [Saprolegnia parasitica CBS 223.65]
MLAVVRTKRFKSLAGTQTVDLSALGATNVVCIFGRNGCGKSCLVDAIAFALGAPAKHLRVLRLDELITHGATKRSASVVATLCDGLTIRRKVVEGAGQSTYAMRTGDGAAFVACSADAVRSALQMRGINMAVQDRFIIRQANTIAVAQYTPLELLAFCEHIIGTTSYRQEIVVLQHKIDDDMHALAELEAATVDLQTRQDRLQPLVDQFLQWTHAWGHLEERQVALAAQEQDVLHALVAHLETHENDALQRHAQLTASDAADVVAEGELRGMLAQQERTLSDANDGRRMLARKRTQAASKLAHVRAELVVLARDADAASTASNRVAKKLQAATASKTKRLRDVNDAEAVVVTLRAEMAKFPEAADTSSSAAAEWVERKAECGTALERSVATLTRLEAEKHALTIAQDLSQCAVASTTKELHEATMRQTDVATNVAAAQERLRVAQDELEAIENTLRTLEHERWQVQEATHEASSDVFRRAVAVLQRQLGGDAVYGVLCDLATVDPCHAAAVNSVLQRHLKVVVVRSRDVGLTIAAHFRTHRLGRVTCAIVDEVAGSCADDGPNAVCRLVACDDAVRSIFHKYCRSWSVVASSEEALARPRTKNANYVTRNGDLFRSDGEIQVTARNDASAWRIQSSAERTTVVSDAPLQKELRRLVGLIDAARKTRLVLEASRTEMLGDAQRWQLASTTATTSMMALERALQGHRADVLRHETQRKRLKPLLDAALADRDRWTQALYQLDAKLCLATPDHMLFERHHACATRLSQAERHLEHAFGELEALPRCIAALEAQQALWRDKTNEIASREATLLDRLEAFTVAMDEAEARCADQRTAADAYRSTLATTRAEMDRLAQRRKALAQELARVRARVAQIRADVHDYRRRLCPCADREASMTFLAAKESWTDLVAARTCLDETRRLLEQEKATMSKEVLTEAAVVRHDLTDAQTRAEDLNQVLATTLQARNHLMHQRYVTLTDALTTLNVHLPEMYRSLCEDGDCYLGFSLDTTTLFGEGITFHCKPDAQQWRPFGGLSGGQQVLCALSLLLSFQASFVCPIFICDGTSAIANPCASSAFQRIDAALDTYNVQRLGKLLVAAAAKTQFIVVSHRTEMWNQSNALVGVYSIGHEGSAILPCRFSAP